MINIVLSDDGAHVVYREFEQPFFDYPINSPELGIYVVSNLSKHVKANKLDDKIVKYVKLPYKGKCVAMPLLHTSN